MANVFAEFGLMLLLSVYYIIPAYVANGLAVVTGGSTPVDLGKNFVDGRRIFGEGKTIRGLIGGVIFGFMVGLIQFLISTPVNDFFQQLILTYDFNPSIGLNAELVLLFNPLRAFLLPFGALIGDLVGSFIKRRIGLARGKPAPLIDQLDFILFALLFSYFLAPISWEYVVIILVFTPLIHLMANIIAYFLKLKKEPW
ncbi:MAG: CDP-2,3-bis-(O-geranylgeranyl)-sn-glycerol synthase [Candidatus Odinarchaeia archaeon]